MDNMYPSPMGDSPGSHEGTDDSVFDSVPGEPVTLEMLNEGLQDVEKRLRSEFKQILKDYVRIDTVEPKEVTQ